MLIPSTPTPRPVASLASWHPGFLFVACRIVGALIVATPFASMVVTPVGAVVQRRAA